MFGHIRNIVNEHRLLVDTVLQERLRHAGSGPGTWGRDTAQAHMLTVKLQGFGNEFGPSGDRSRHPDHAELLSELQAEEATCDGALAAAHQCGSGVPPWHFVNVEPAEKRRTQDDEEEIGGPAGHAATSAAMAARAARPPGRQRLLSQNGYGYTWVFNTWFEASRKSPIFGVWAAPAPQKNLPKGGGRRPPPFGMVCGAAGTAQTPKIDDLRPAPKPCLNNPSVKGPGRPQTPARNRRSARHLCEEVWGPIGRHVGYTTL